MILLISIVSDIDYYAPYPALSERISTHISYLDTVGRPKVTLKYKQLTDRHGGVIYVRSFGSSYPNSVLSISALGYLQGAVHRTHAQGSRFCDSASGFLRPRARCEASRYSHPEEMIVSFLPSSEYNLIFVRFPCEME